MENTKHTTKKQMAKQNKTTKQNKSDITTKISFNDTNNHNMHIFVHRSGDTNQSLHDVKKCSVGKWETLNERTKTKDIRIIHDDGTETDITLFKNK